MRATRASAYGAARAVPGTATVAVPDRLTVEVTVLGAMWSGVALMARPSGLIAIPNSPAVGVTTLVPGRDPTPSVTVGPALEGAALSDRLVSSLVARVRQERTAAGALAPATRSATAQAALSAVDASRLASLGVSDGCCAPGLVRAAYPP